MDDKAVLVDQPGLDERSSEPDAALREQVTTDALNAVLGTMSFWARLSPRQRDALCAENHALHQRLGSAGRSAPAPSPAW
jgi:hypothetical protein